ncbi:phosphatidate cytidylyltransferase [Labrys monachus]|uniref:Phosphatidate cytidylyltransferase n=2 Tax=Labrys monachus TaxID=217067 RepID=A0ABU0FGN8_9HYPH|nr:phosphatidate cytidylyltransferase [Labrys monachus]MDQ0393225.1 phosphatidate cytidylyltransferase [Labrys monachus]
MASASKANWSDLAVRLASAIVMAGLALLTNWLGGLAFALFWLLASLAVLAEWLALVTPGETDRLAIGVGAAVLAGSAWLAYAGGGVAAILSLLAGAAALWARAAACRRRHPGLIAAALPYAGAVVLPAVLLRHDGEFGMRAILVLFAIVWGSDVMAYFTGRTLGGPKLCPRISPKKTWSGFVGGVGFGGIAAGLVAQSFALGLLGAALAAISQGGDLLESMLKRRFDAKDASHLIPGHGGVMDRLDGFVAAALAALVIGWLHAGLHPARGFLMW